MTQPRCKLVDPFLTPYYHCISECVRQMKLCGGDCEHRKEWIENRLQELAGIFAIEVCAYAVMSNHMHVILRLNTAVAAGWTDEEVIRRWGALYPPRPRKRGSEQQFEDWVQDRLQDADWIRERRSRLNSLGWFMKNLKEPLARMANREDNRRGNFWVSRYKSISVLDPGALISQMVYTDLNVVAAGLAPTPEESRFTSIRTRVEHSRATGTLDRVRDQPEDRTLRDRALEDESHWLVPIEDRRERPPGGAEITRVDRIAGRRAGISDQMNLASYLKLVDWSSRLLREGKCRVPAELPPILERLGMDADTWEDTLHRLRDREPFFGTVFGLRAADLDEAAARRGVSRVANLNGCPR